MGDTLAVELRENTGKGVARKLRVAGRAPGIFYGHGVDSIAVTFDPDQLEQVLRRSGAGLNTLIDLEGAAPIGGKTVIVKDMQRHPLRGSVLHADLYQIDITERIAVSVPIHLIGTPVGVSMDGGVLEHALRELELDCMPRSIPDSIDVDVAALQIGDTLHVGDLQLPEGVELLTDRSQAVASVSHVKIVEEAVAEPAVDGEAVPAEADRDGDGESEKGSGSSS